MQVIALPQTEGENKAALIYIEDVHSHRLRTSCRWGVSLAKAHVICALDLMAGAQEEMGFKVGEYVHLDRDGGIRSV